MMVSAGAVSVVIPTFDRARFLTDAVGSVLDQTHRDLEVIVVDDGSTDETANVLGAIADPRLRVIRIAHSGSPAHARNVGVGAARGDWIAFLDSDDVWRPEKLERQLAALAADPAGRWSYTLFDHIDERGTPMAALLGDPGTARSGWVLGHIVAEGALVMVQSVLAQKALVREVGGFDEAPALREDLDFCLRLAARSPACGLQDALVSIRHHPRRTTFALPEVRNWKVRALDKLATSTSDRAVRAECRRRCRSELVDLARAYDWAGRTRDALGALARAARYGPWVGLWWTTLAKTIARPVTSRRLLAAYRRRREARADHPAGLPR